MKREPIDVGSVKNFLKKVPKNLEMSIIFRIFTM